MKRLAFAALAIASPALADERSLSVTDFDRLRVDGGFIVEVRTGSATTAKIIGTQAALDITSVDVQARQLSIRRTRSGWSGGGGKEPPAATVRITVPLLATVRISGPSKVSIDRLKGQSVAASLEGSGALTIATITADRANLAMLGSGVMAVSGLVGTLTLAARGSGTFDGGKLIAADAKLVSESAGTVTLSVKRAVDVAMAGTGSVVILGKPACKVKNIGSGTVSCGSDQPKL